MNKVILMGNLTRDPEGGSTNSGVSFCRFGLAVQRRFQNAEGERETDFFNCIAWRNTADFITKYFKKGDKTLITGSIQNRAFEGQDGQKRTATDIIVEEAEFTASKAKEGEKQAQMKLAPVEEDPDLLPF